MPLNFLTKIFGSRNERVLKRYRQIVAKIGAFEAKLENLSDADLQGKTAEFKERLHKGETLDALLPEAFAVVREASKRTLSMRHFDVQLLGGIALHEGKISEMRTGEGKTLCATLPVYLNALTGKGVHVVTINDYLATRDAKWMERVYEFLGMTVGVNLSGLEREEKQAAYQADITYGTNNEFGFDYLRDHMVYDLEDRVQRTLNYAIVDEVDSILIDEARTPLIISGQAQEATSLYHALRDLVPQLVRQEGEADPRTGEGVIKPGDFTVDEKSSQVVLTESGHEKAESLLAELGLIPSGASLYEAAHISLMHHLYAALRAEHLFHRDQHYVVQNGEVTIVDEFTGRLMPGRRWSDGLHQAVEAKERVEIQPENRTLASITFQNYFRLYSKLSGMTGTADTEAYEFQHIYGLETIIIPPNRPSQRVDQQDRIYKSMPEKYAAVIEEIRECHKRGQPVLVGTTSIENSEYLSKLLQEAKLSHQVLNAKQHEKEAEIVAQAGHSAMITIATNMAGRGTDIVLGGNIEKNLEALRHDETLDAQEREKRIAAQIEAWRVDHDRVVQEGGLRIVATERHESRRIDNQLRGRSGRQGDPGSSRFYLSLEDQLMRIFAGDRMRAIMERLKMPDGEPLEAGIVTRAIESAQRKVEARNFDVRKQLLEYDDVSNDQRRVIYEQRNLVLEAAELTEQIKALRESAITDVVRTYLPEDSIEEQWDIEGLKQTLSETYQVELPLLKTWMEQNEMHVSIEAVTEHVLQAANASFEAKMSPIQGDGLQSFQRMVLLQSMDSHWRDHLSALDYLRQGIHLRGYAQKQPKQEYKREAFELFAQMLDSIKQEVTRVLMNLRIESAPELTEAAHAIEDGVERDIGNLAYLHPTDSNEEDGELETEAVSASQHVGRNQLCPCGSGKKYKHCHGRVQ